MMVLEAIGIYLAPGLLLCGLMAGSGQLENVCAVAAHRNGQPLTRFKLWVGGEAIALSWPWFLLVFVAGLFGART